MSEYFDKYTKHIIDTEFYAQYQEDYFTHKMENLRKKLRAFLKENNLRLTKSQYKKILSDCKEISDKEIDEYFEEYKKEREDFSKKERNYLKALVIAILGLVLAKEITKSIRDKKLLEGTSNIDDFKEKLKTDVYNAVRKPLFTDYIFGSPASTSTETVDSAVEKTINISSSFIHTDVTAIQRNLLSTVTTDVKLQYVSMLDDKTCAVCGGYSGKVYNSISDAPTLPIHERCRCYLIPLKENEESGMTYSQWLRSQPDSVQYKILGPARYALYKAGVDVESFSSKGKKLTLKELYSS